MSVVGLLLSIWAEKEEPSGFSIVSHCQRVQCSLAWQQLPLKLCPLKQSFLAYYNLRSLLLSIWKSYWEDPAASIETADINHSVVGHRARLYSWWRDVCTQIPALLLLSSLLSYFTKLWLFILNSDAVLRIPRSGCQVSSVSCYVSLVVQAIDREALFDPESSVKQHDFSLWWLQPAEQN